MAATATKRKADRTRARILEAAEQHFAEHGFTDARLEDIAKDVGVKRAALFYHFRDKQALYEAVKQELFGGFLGRIDAILGRPGSVAERLEAAVEAWVEAIGNRPSMAHVLLREAASVPADIMQSLPSADPFLEKTKLLFAEGVRRGELNPTRRDPFHVISAVVGFTVFYVAALRRLLPTVSFDPLDPVELAGHKSDAIRVARRLLGIGTPRVVKPGRKPRGRM